MHSLVRRYLKTAIAFLAVGLAIGGWMIAQRELAGRFPSPYLASAHTHAIFVGFVMMMILGVALWMFPRPAADDTRYRPSLASLAYWLVTIGTAARVVGELLRPQAPHRALGWAILLSGVAQIVGIGVFFYTMWSRIRATGSAARERAGEKF
jgi:heme/copper-type cytochrome/quinol oxidase subunit 1